MSKTTLRANARTMSKIQPVDVAAKDLITDLSFLPDRYAMHIVGACLEPEVRDGSIMMFDRTEPYRVGDLVVLFRRPEALAEGVHQVIVKRLIMAPPSWVSFPWRDHPQSDVIALVGLEMLIPRRRFAMRCADLLGIHKCLSAAPEGSTMATIELADATKEATR